MRIRRLVTVLLSLAALSARTGHAQYRPGQWGAGVRIGVSPYDLEGTGTALVLAPEADLMLNRVLLAELSIPGGGSPFGSTVRLMEAGPCMPASVRES
jgi:hypothetical protein